MTPVSPPGTPDTSEGSIDPESGTTTPSGTGSSNTDPENIRSDSDETTGMEPVKRMLTPAETTVLVPIPGIKMGLDPNRYLFERSRLQLPFYLATLVPPEVHRALDNLRLTASAAFESFKILEKYAAQCYFRLCGLEDRKRAEKHWYSMNLLFTYEPPYDPENPTLVKAAGIPQSLLGFHVQESAYRAYEMGFSSLKYDFLNGTYDAFLNARCRLHDIFNTCEMSKMNMSLWRRWAKEFLEEMRKWEDYIDDVSIPTLDGILWDVIEMVVDKVDFADTSDLVENGADVESYLFSSRYALKIHEDAVGGKIKN